MNKQDLISVAVGGFLFHDINNGHPIFPKPASTTDVFITMDCGECLSDLIVTHNRKPLSKEEEVVFSRLNEVWGDDEDGEYANLYQHHQNLKAHAM